MNSDNPLWTESALKFYEEQELSMNVNPDQNLPPSAHGVDPSPTDFDEGRNNHQLNIHHFSPSDLMDPNIPPSLNVVGPHYSSILETSRTKLRQRMPDSSDVRNNSPLLLFPSLLFSSASISVIFFCFRFCYSLLLPFLFLSSSRTSSRKFRVRNDSRKIHFRHFWTFVSTRKTNPLFHPLFFPSYPFLSLLFICIFSILIYFHSFSSIYRIMSITN